MQHSQVHKKLKELDNGRAQKVWNYLLVFNSRFHLFEFSVSFAFSVLLVAMIRHSLSPGKLPVFRSGEIASQTVRSNIHYEIEDPESTLLEKNQLSAKVAPVYDFERELVSVFVEQWKKAVSLMRAKPKSFWTQSKFASEVFGFSISFQELKVLQSLAWSQDLERSISFSMGPLWEQKIVEQRPVVSTRIEVFEVKSARSTFLKNQEVSSLLTVEEARALVSRAARTESRSLRDSVKMPWSAWSAPVREVVFSLQSRLIRPNFTYNRKESENRKDQVLQDYRPSSIRVEKGDVVVRAGERVSSRSEMILNEMNRKAAATPMKRKIFLESLFASFFLWLVMLFLRRQFPKHLAGVKNTYVSAGILLTSVACFKLVVLFEMNVVADYFLNIPPTFFLFLIPIAAPAMMVRLLIQIPFAALTAVLFSVAIAVMLESGAAMGAHVLVVSLMSIHFIKYCPTRTSLHVAGLRSAVISGMSSLAILSAWGGIMPTQMGIFLNDSQYNHTLLSAVLWTVAGGIIGGWLSSALTLIVTPILENILDYTTDLKLLELARMDNPLLKELVLKAPGTYHHSIVVGSLVEAACEAVGANALLARVGCYYHDIGKIGRAEYFVENQSNGRNPHDHISPHMSAKIIMSHVKEGVKLAEEAKLGASLINFIESHHGNSLVSYFYNKAKQEAAQPEGRLDMKEVAEGDFRYPGPRPKTKEASIVALADSCEAATRSLVEPTPARIEGMVKKIVSRAFNEGLLDEADITLREVNLVGQAFVKILMGFHHTRIQYQDQEVGLPKRSNTLSFIKSRGSN